jgi:hypothetical protein
MNLIEAKVQQWSDDTLKKMVADYEQFERDGAIGQWQDDRRQEDK